MILSDKTQMQVDTMATGDMLDQVKSAMLKCANKFQELEDASKQLTDQKLRYVVRYHKMMCLGAGLEICSQYLRMWA